MKFWKRRRTNELLRDQLLWMRAAAALLAVRWQPWWCAWAIR
ncbi:MAG: hypothetical protein ACLRRT_01175 [Ruthenibacterium lactatiformans]